MNAVITAKPVRNQNVHTAARPGNTKLRRGAAFGIIILAALVAFEIFNYSTTDYALGDLLGGLEFAGVRWSTILAIAFCGIDFAGIARLFSPEKGASEPNEAWYLFGAWLLAATMNAILTWWGVSMAIASHPMESVTVMDQGLLVKAVPVFVSIMVWLIRILIIGSLSYTSGRLFSAADRPQTLPARPVSSYHTNPVPAASHAQRPTIHPAARRPVNTPEPAAVQMGQAAASRHHTVNQAPAAARPEPTYHNVAMRPAANHPAAQAHNHETRR